MKFRREDTGWVGLRGKPARQQNTSHSLCQVLAHSLVLFCFAFAEFSTSEYPLILLLFFASTILYTMVLGHLCLLEVDMLAR